LKKSKPQGQSLQAMEPDVFGKLFSASGQTSLHTERKINKKLTRHKEKLTRHP